MQIINVIQTDAGIIQSVESFIIDESLSKTNKYFFTEEEAVEKAENLFVQCIKDNYKFDDNQNSEEIIEEALSEGVFADEGGNYYEVIIVWSGINVNE